MFAVLKNYNTKLQFFFNDIEFAYSSDQNFIRRLLTSLDCQIYPNETIIAKAGRPLDCIYFNYTNKINVLDEREIFVLSTLPEGSWFGDFNAFIGVNSAFTYVAHYDPDSHKESSGAESERIMIFQCPIERFITICKDYPQSYEWMAKRSLMRRNYFM